jgi:hypothetical protein
MTLSERMNEAVQWYLHAVAEIARRARDNEHSLEMMNAPSRAVGSRAETEGSMKLSVVEVETNFAEALTAMR